jgi:cell division protein FtsW (lipid II flippase)
MHLRPPSVSRGFASFLWALLFGIVIWAGLIAVDVDFGTALVLGLTFGTLIFFYVRLFGGDEFPDRR